MSEKPSLPLGKQIAYSIGQWGWSILVNVVGLQLVYFYVPPQDAGIPYLITQVTFLGVLNAIALIAASGRLVDAITDPLIANLSDRSTHPKGRRIPFMALGAVPAALFFALMFFPPARQVATINIIWLVVAQILFYISLTLYVTPFFALLPELSRTANDRLNMSTWISITYALGIIVAGLTPVLAGVYRSALGVEPLVSLQYAVGTLGIVAVALMLAPVLTIDERKYCASAPSTAPLLQALKNTFQNPNFKFYVVADFSYFMGLTIIMTGLLYYITVLLGLEEALVGALLPVMIIVSFLFYVPVNLLAKRTGKKILVVISFFSMSLIFLAVYFMGRLPIPPVAQAYLLVILYALPLSFLSVLPNAILADIAEHDGLASGERKEGMFFAARTLMQKFGQTLGILIFAILTTFGKDVGNDLGVRLSGLVGFALCLAAGIAFTRYNEKKLLLETRELQAAAQR